MTFALTIKCFDGLHRSSSEEYVRLGTGFYVSRNGEYLVVFHGGFGNEFYDQSLLENPSESMML
jgi:hypothetical protein